MRAQREKPFGDDEDANQAVASVLSVVGDLSREARKLVRVNFRDINAELRQRGLVRDLRERVESRARSVHVDPAIFMEAARVELEQRLGRRMPIPSAAEIESSNVDPEARRLEGELLDAQIHEQLMTRRLSKARENFTNARAATAIARAALEGYRP